MMFRLLGVWVLLAMTKVREVRRDRDRGDVPGWVMVTVETASRYT